MALQSSPIVVHKFGGAALADATAISHVGAILAAEPTGPARVVVTSALQGVTNVLLSAIGHALAGEHAEARAIVSALRARELAVAEGAAAGGDGASREVSATLAAHVGEMHDELERQLVTLGGGDDASPALSDAILAHGERLAARIVSVMLAVRGLPSVVVDGAALVQTDGRRGNAAPDLERTDALAVGIIGPFLDRGLIVVVPGFTGAGVDGAVVTLDAREASELAYSVRRSCIPAR